MTREAFLAAGWCRFEFDTALSKWVEQTLPAARAAVAEPENAGWLRCGDTWFAGVNVLPNDPRGAVKGGTPLAGRAVDSIVEWLGLTELSWDRAQVSVVYPGYPRPMATESPTAFRYRRDRDAAHLDGLLPEGPRRRRHLREHHAFILGVPLLPSSSDGSPVVVWEGSHEVFRRRLKRLFEGKPPEAWQTVDLTEVYQRTRREIFESCRRITISASPGESYLIHRLALHGVAPWAESSSPEPEGRMIAYFRPEIGDARRWLLAP